MGLVLLATGRPSPRPFRQSAVYNSRRPQYLVGMDRLNPEQARKIHEALGPATGYLWRLVERMCESDLRLRDPELYRLVTAARDAMLALTVELHYQSCKSGVGRPPTGA
jgi:hypothetical protein